MENRNVITTNKEKVFYGFGDFGANLMWSFIGAYAMQYLTDNVMMSAAFLGTMMLFCRLFDGVSDIFMGIVIEKTHSRFGKARPWFGIAALPTVVFFFMLFSVPKMDSTATKIYVTFVYFIYTVVLYTAGNLSYHAMLSRISNDHVDQSKISAVRTIFSGLGAALATVIAPVLLSAFGGEKEQKAWTVITIPYAIISLIAMFICYIKIKEKNEITDLSGKKNSSTDIINGLKSLLKTKYFYVAVSMFILCYLLTNSVSAIGVYYTRDILGNSNYFSMFSLIPMIVMLFGVVVDPILIKTMGKQKALVAASIAIIIGTVIPCANPYSFIVCIIGLIIKGLGTAIFACELYTLAADIILYLERKIGVRIEGLATSANSFGSKVGMGLGLAIVGWGLDMSGYDSTAALQTQATLNMEIALNGGCPL